MDHADLRPLLEIQMKSNSPAKISLRKRVTDELEEVAIIAAYLYVCFAAILYLKVSILKAHGIEICVSRLCRHQSPDLRQVRVTLGNLPRW